MEDKVEKGNKEIKDTMEQRGLKKKKKSFFPIHVSQNFLNTSEPLFFKFYTNICNNAG